LGGIIATPSLIGRCWQYTTAQQREAMPASERANHCDAVLHPNEVDAALDLRDKTQAKMAKAYRNIFNTNMDVRRTKRPTRS
jgi:hypothetical protein